MTEEIQSTPSGCLKPVQRLPSVLSGTRYYHRQTRRSSVSGLKSVRDHTATPKRSFISSERCHGPPGKRTMNREKILVKAVFIVPSFKRGTSDAASSGLRSVMKPGLFS